MIPETVHAPRVVREDGRTPFRAPQAGVDPVGAQDFVTKGWAEANLGGGGGAPIEAEYLVKSASGGLSAERVVANSIYIAWNWSTPGQVTAEIDPGVFVYLSAIFAPIVHTHDAADIASGVVAAARLGTGTPGSGSYLRGDGVWSATSAFAAASHTHAASDVTSGTFATARLGSGSASGTTVLLGDSTWGFVPTGAIADNAITNAKLRDSAGLSVLGRSSNSTGDPADIAAASDHQVMRRSGTAIGFGAINLAQSAAVTGALPIANGGTGATSASAARTALDAAAAAHNHTDLRQIVIDTSNSSGALAGSGITNLGELVDWLDSNLPLP